MNPSAPVDPVDPSEPLGNYDEVVIRRHAFGLAALYLEVLLGAALIYGLVYWLLPGMIDGDMAQLYSWLNFIGAILGVFIVVFLLLATLIYRENKWVVTSDSIQQVLKRGIFNRQISELSMANIEDVTAEQKGLLAMLFGFGTLKAETAGELPYFRFIYCPNPNTYAKIILAARQRYVDEEPEEAKRANDLLNIRRSGKH